VQAGGAVATGRTDRGPTKVTQTSSAWDRFCGSIRLMFSIVPSPTSDSVLHIRLHAETYKNLFLSLATGSNIGPMPYYSRKYWTQKSHISSQSPFIACLLWYKYYNTNSLHILIYFFLWINIHKQAYLLCNKG
jgi:hypothetical protein